MTDAPKDGGSAFPGYDPKADQTFHGMSLRDWFATFAAEPRAEDISLEMQRDKNRNPYNEGHKPKLRTTHEIVADLKYERADAMLKARQP